MGYAAYRYASSPRQAATAFVVLDVIAEVREAAHVRHAASACAGAGVLRCIPLQQDGRVRLQVRCPQCEVEHLMQQVMRLTVAAEFGRVACWADHLAACQAARHG